MAETINSGTAEGLLAFCDYLTDKGYGGAAAVNALKSAAKQVFQKVDGENFGSVNVIELDVDEYVGRFEVKARSEYKQESLATYRKRFTRAVEYYRAFLRDGSVPQFRAGVGRSKAASAATGSSKKGAQQTGSPRLETPSPSTPDDGLRLIDYPFPLRTGQLAYLRLPKRLEKADAERIGAFVMTLAFEPQLELTTGSRE